ncbi:hypothetical protein E1264_13860 [Actinomadura sp. KC216]|uniref:hypothetical protein n=1 Tax=Actinomadura sp. KC216 TaxID=2530370 RepID=UPI001044077C|nr:hypothetical protein [Actinomadura sp. KC216]TDB87725.1 hypothetical protein E1264_13860 [Actinomadura sp. KC216]
MNYIAMALAAVGAIAVLYLLNASITVTPATIEKARTVTCSPVLSARSGKETLEIPLKDTERIAIHGACDQARIQRLGWTLLVAVPTAIAGALIVPRGRPTSSPA